MEWHDFTPDLKAGRPLLTREFLGGFIDDFCTGMYWRIDRRRVFTCCRAAKYREQNIDYILSTPWEEVLRRTIHKVNTMYMFERSVEYMFFMEAVRLMMAAEIAGKDGVRLGERIEATTGSMLFRSRRLFGVRAESRLYMRMFLRRESYGWSDSIRHPKLAVELFVEGDEGYRKELDGIVEDLYSRIDAVCLSENMRMVRGARQGKRSREAGVPAAVLRSRDIPYVDWREAGNHGKEG